MLRVITDIHTHDDLRVDLDTIVGEDARRMLAAALEVEVDACLAAFAAEPDDHGSGPGPPAGVNGPRLVALVCAGARVDKAVLGERPAADGGTVAA